MARLNLLPWREARRKDEDRELLVMAAGAWVVTGLLVAYGSLHAHGVVRAQKERNQYLQQQITLVNSQMIRRSGVFGLRSFPDHYPAVYAQFGPRGDGHGAQFAGAG